MTKASAPAYKQNERSAAKEAKAEEPRLMHHRMGMGGMHSQAPVVAKIRGNSNTLWCESRTQRTVSTPFYSLSVKTDGLRINGLTWINGLTPNP